MVLSVMLGVFFKRRALKKAEVQSKQMRKSE